MDTHTRNLALLQKIGPKLAEISKALKGCQEATGKLSEIVDAVAKSYAVLQVESVSEQLEDNGK